MPFEIPKGWELARLTSVTELYTGNSISASDKTRFFTGLHEGRNYIGTKDILYDHSINYDNGIKIPHSFNKFRVAPQSSILLCIEGGSAGRKIAMPTEDVCFGNKLCCFIPFEINSRYLYYYFQSPFFRDAFKENMSGIIGGVSLNKLKSMLLVLPPLQEQQRIINKIEELLFYIHEYKETNDTLEKLDTNFPEHLKRSILQHAVQGKLAPQNSLDEPVEVLLERIRVEKQKLINEGKIRKDKNESIIFRRDNSHYEMLKGVEHCIDEEIPFEIPESWKWVRAFQVIQLQSGQDLSSDKYNTNEDGVPYITGASNINDNKVIINRWTTNGRSFAYNGDLLITCKGTVGSVAFLTVDKAHIARQIMAIRPLHEVNIEYIKYFFESYVNQLNLAAKSMIPGISREDILLTLIPLPPAKEQYRIVEKLKVIIANIEYL